MVFRNSDVESLAMDVTGQILGGSGIEGSPQAKFVFGAGIFVEIKERGHSTRCGWCHGYVRARRGEGMRSLGLGHVFVHSGGGWKGEGGL